MRAIVLKTLFFALVGVMLTSMTFDQRRYSMIIDDIDGGDGVLTHNIADDAFELTLQSYRNAFNFAKVEVIDRSVSPFPIVGYYFKTYDMDIVSDFYIGFLEFDKPYEFRIIFSYYDDPQVLKKAIVIRRKS